VVLQFVKQNISKMNPEERIAAGDGLRALHDASKWHAAYSSGVTMPDRLLKRIHRDLRGCINTLFDESPANDGGHRFQKRAPFTA
jgi:hypothetical protein